MDNNNIEMISEVASFYYGKSVFLTGATGFLGKALVEKLLRSCDGIGNIYVLVRPKRGCESRARVDDFLNCPLFDLLRSEKGWLETKQKIVPISGDMTLPGLGISAEERAILVNNVSIVIHSAATVRFDEPLKKAVKLNVEGTLAVLELAQSMKNLCSVVHVSTAYSNCDRSDIEEVIYPTKVNPRDVIRSFEWMDDEIVDSVQTKLLGEKPNTYTYTKHLAEMLVHEARQNGLPVCIVRPSIVVATYSEPMPGWVDNLNGPSGIFVAFGKGVLRSLLCHDSQRLDVIPLDHVVSLTIAAAWFQGTQSPNKIMQGNNGNIVCQEQSSMEVFHCISGAENPYYLKRIVPWAMSRFWDVPFKEVLWYPSPCLTTSPLLNNINNVLVHWIPAQILDMRAKLKGEKPMMMFVYHKIKAGVLALRYFCTHEWNFSRENTKALYKMMNKKDQQLFQFNVMDVDWKIFTDHYINGIRKYLIKEDDSCIQDARKNLRKMYILHRGTQVVIYSLLFIFFGLLFLLLLQFF